MIAVLRKLVTCCFMTVLFGVMACVPNADRPVTATLEGDAAGGVVIRSPKGPPGPMADLLAQSVAAALVQRGYVAHTEAEVVMNNAAAAYYVSGTAEAMEPVHAPTVAALHWILYDGTGKEIAYLTQGVRGNPDSWAYGSPAMLRIVGEEAAVDFSPFLGSPPNIPVASVAVRQPVSGDGTASTEPESQPQSQAQQLARINDDGVLTAQQPVIALPPLPAPPTPPPLPVTTGLSGKRAFGLWLDEVTGAPGNGNAALTQAIYTDLKSHELPFALTPGLASHYIQGVVDVAVRSATQEHVTIVWVVSNAEGDEIGRVSQRNDIVRGSLHGDWGETAVYAAHGGLEGVLAILERDLEGVSAQ